VAGVESNHVSAIFILYKLLICKLSIYLYLAYQMIVNQSFKYTTILLLSVCLSLHLSAQLNLGVGFSVGSGTFGGNNAILQEYNVNRQVELEKAYSDLNLLTGVYVSGRYKVDNIAFEFSWENLNRNLSSVLVFSDRTGREDKLYYSISTASFGIENHIDRYGYGASVGTRLLRLKADILNTDAKRSIIGEREFTTKLYLLYTIQKSRLISVVAKPFVQIPMGKYALSELEDDLMPHVTKQDRDSAPYIFGLSFLFYNGLQ